MNRGMNKQNGEYPYNGIVFSNKNEPTVDTCNIMAESQIMLSDGSQVRISSFQHLI